MYFGRYSTLYLVQCCENKLEQQCDGYIFTIILSIIAMDVSLSLSLAHFYAASRTDSTCIEHNALPGDRRTKDISFAQHTHTQNMNGEMAKRIAKVNGLNLNERNINL